MSNNKKSENDVYSAPYTKAGLANKAAESVAESETKEVKSNKNDSAEHTPKISKEKAAERDLEKPAH